MGSPLIALRRDNELREATEVAGALIEANIKRPTVPLQAPVASSSIERMAQVHGISRPDCRHCGTDFRTGRGPDRGPREGRRGGQRRGDRVTDCADEGSPMAPNERRPA